MPPYGYRSFLHLYRWILIIVNVGPSLVLATSGSLPIEDSRLVYNLLSSCCTFMYNIYNVHLYTFILYIIFKNVYIRI